MAVHNIPRLELVPPTPIGSVFNLGFSQNESLKITVKFLSNEIRSDGLDVIIFKKTCNNNFNCSTVKLESNLSNEIKSEILKKATIIKEQIPNPNENYRNPSKKGD